ncbi:hypothetical protein N7517_001623 [Penicillium concentricum]|uniref:Uncharacterized protein n=1 Tax=Penicillium concentricum TaxID=293559 RepID=A0A9W9VJ14_9EURO|nr:uncharacterized protein N7517_001623 [Penicillium concentricum]KAJ5383712.1 hypothetical protein N7517_001623 [Penicillium concentricum]
MSRILDELEYATCAVIWVVLLIGSCAAADPNHIATKNKLTETKKKWMDDKRHHLQRRQDQMVKGGVDADGLEMMTALERNLDEHRFKIRQNWRELADLLDRYSD